MSLLLRNLCFLLLLFTVSCSRQQATDSIAPLPGPRASETLTDEELMEKVQRQTFRYFWDFAHPVSGLARERSNVSVHYGGEVTTIGGSGFGVMALVVGVERGWITREQGLDRLLKIVNFLLKADHYHGIFPHWLNGETGRTIPFSRNDDGGDVVESAFLFQGLLTVRQYFTQGTPRENELRNKIGRLWNDADWTWYTKGGENVLYWHWSPNQGWAMNHQIKGWNECLIAYVLAAASPRFSISPEVYHQGWATGSTHFTNGKEYYGIRLPLGFAYGGPLFFAHYSFLGLDLRGLKDRYADYWEQNVNHTLINRAYCIDNPKKYKGYSARSWGLTASDNHQGYAAHSPTEDLGVITPTAALSSMPYTPQHSLEAMRFFHDSLGHRLWSEYGFRDAFNLTEDWFADSHLAIDQGPIIIMIENHRTGLLWNLFMKDPEIQKGLKKLGFQSPALPK